MNENNWGKQIFLNLRKILYLFYNPSKVFKDIIQEPSFLIPLIIAIIIQSCFIIFTSDIKNNDDLIILKSQNASQEKIELAQSQINDPAKFYLLPLVPINILLSWALWAGIVYIIGNKVMHGNSRFNQIYSIIAWSSIIGIELDMFINMILILIKNTTIGVNTSFVLFLTQSGAVDKTTFLYNFLSELKFFSIWHVILLTIGLKILYDFSKKKSFILSLFVLMPYAIIISLFHVISKVFF